jgi:hypothetical protein
MFLFKKMWLTRQDKVHRTHVTNKSCTIYRLSGPPCLNIGHDTGMKNAREVKNWDFI